MKRRSSRRCHWWYGMLFGVFCTTCVQAQEASGFVRCATDQREALKQSLDRNYRQGKDQLEDRIQSYLNEQGANARIAANEVIRIPVVIHVIHNQSDLKIGGAGNTNISDEQIRSQIIVLNEDYRRKAGTNGFNTNVVGADTKIEFELAQYDPNGHLTTGIVRKYSKTTEFSPYTDDVILAGLSAWPTDRYLNIWVCPLFTTFLGVAQLPSADSFDGLDNKKKDQALTDGVIIDYRYFGSVQHLTSTGSITSKTYNQGRTTTHEVGHWLGLLHTWGVVDNTCGTDYCADTPQARAGNLTFDCTPRFVTCSGITSQVMIENYMDYSADICMNVFTRNQLDRMNAVLSVSPRRAALLKSIIEGRLSESESLALELFPNPADTELFATVRFKDYQSFSLGIYDVRGGFLRETKFTDVWSRKVPIDTATLPPGVYVCRVSTGKETISRRFVIR